MTNTKEKLKTIRASIKTREYELKGMRAECNVIALALVDLEGDDLAQYLDVRHGLLEKKLRAAKDERTRYATIGAIKAVLEMRAYLK